MKRRSLLYFGIGLAVFGASSFLPVAAQSRRGVTRRVQFPRGSTSTTINGSVVLGNKDTYIFRARQGQTIITDVTWVGTRVDNVEDQGLSGFTFIAPNGESYEDPQDIYFNAKSTGDYKVVVRQPYRMSSPRYRFKLTIR
ncbi:hypothetical protein [Argonema galeatum]|uniref:hypothetical protein n=1 Tax=Argonema galeatum TaxID=2942762 RepID=UPI0020119F7F|nr:hypothetical protein [Argonema galeatum]MCL1468155.1 hypothetical protein [Argonema galeatum A003/A1]